MLKIQNPNLFPNKKLLPRISTLFHHLQKKVYRLHKNTLKVLSPLKKVSDLLPSKNNTKRENNKLHHKLIILFVFYYFHIIHISFTTFYFFLYFLFSLFVLFFKPFLFTPFLFFRVFNNLFESFGCSISLI